MFLSAALILLLAFGRYCPFLNILLDQYYKNYSLLLSFSFILLYTFRAFVAYLNFGLLVTFLENTQKCKVLLCSNSFFSPPTTGILDKTGCAWSATFQTKDLKLLLTPAHRVKTVNAVCSFAACAWVMWGDRIVSFTAGNCWSRKKVFYFLYKHH